MDSEWWGWDHDAHGSQDFTPETTESQQTFREHLVEKGLERKQRHDEWSQQAWWFADQALPEKVDELLADEPLADQPAEVVEPGSLPGDDILLGTIKFSKDWTKQLATLMGMIGRTAMQLVVGSFWILWAPLHLNMNRVLTNSR